MTEDEALRLHKFLAQAGIASRRAAEALIQQGRVRLNGAVVETLGVKIDPNKDEVSVDGQAVRHAEARTTVLLSKPAGVITSMHDPEGRRTVATLLGAEPYRLVPVGRLDFHTEGVLLLTTDGELAHRLLHPSHKVPKIYVVKVGGHPTEASLDKLRSGIELEDGMTLPALVDVIDTEDRTTWLEIIITEGRQRQVRRMCEAVGHRPLRVVRTAFATLTSDGLEPGQYRYLSRSELAGLYKIVGLTAPPPSERARELGADAQGEGERGKGPLPGDERSRVRRGAAQARPREATRGRGAEATRDVRAGRSEPGAWAGEALARPRERDEAAAQRIPGRGPAKAPKVVPASDARVPLAPEAEAALEDEELIAPTVAPKLRARPKFGREGVAAPVPRARLAAQALPDEDEDAEDELEAVQGPDDDADDAPAPRARATAGEDDDHEGDADEAVADEAPPRRPARRAAAEGVRGAAPRGRGQAEGAAARSPFGAARRDEGAAPRGRVGGRGTFGGRDRGDTARDARTGPPPGRGGFGTSRDRGADEAPRGRGFGAGRARGADVAPRDRGGERDRGATAGPRDRGGLDPRGEAPRGRGFGAARERDAGEAPRGRGFGAARERDAGEAPRGRGFGAPRDRGEGEAPRGRGFGAARERDAGEAPRGRGFGAPRDRGEGEAPRGRRDRDAPRGPGADRERADEAPRGRGFGAPRGRSDGDAPRGAREHGEREAPRDRGRDASAAPRDATTRAPAPRDRAPRGEGAPRGRRFDAASAPEGRAPRGGARGGRRFDADSAPRGRPSPRRGAPRRGR